MTFALSATIGGLITATGIVMGNKAIWKMMDAYEESINERRAKEEMFMAGASTSPGNSRTEAGRWYRQTHPDGPFLGMLKRGQILTVTGFLITIVLLAI